MGMFKDFAQTAMFGGYESSFMGSYKDEAELNKELIGFVVDLEKRVQELEKKVSDLENQTVATEDFHG